MVALDFLVQKVALIVASTHWVWVSIQGVNAPAGVGALPPRCVLSVRERWYYYITYNFIRHILYIIYNLPLGGAEDGTQSLTHKCPG